MSDRACGCVCAVLYKEHDPIETVYIICQGQATISRHVQGGQDLDMTAQFHPHKHVTATAKAPKLVPLVLRLRRKETV
jgi:hypothetical protein